VWLITTNYIERERGLCCRNISNVQLIRVQDISYSQSCCCSCCGTITVYSSDTTDEELIIKGVPDARRVYGQLREAVTAVQSRAKLEIGA